MPFKVNLTVPFFTLGLKTLHHPQPEEHWMKKTTYKHFQNFFDNLCIFSQKLWTSQLWLKKKFYMIWPNVWDVTMWHISFIIQTQVSCRIKFGFARPTSSLKYFPKTHFHSVHNSLSTCNSLVYMLWPNMVKWSEAEERFLPRRAWSNKKNQKFYFINPQF